MPCGNVSMLFYAYGNIILGIIQQLPYLPFYFLHHFAKATIVFARYKIQYIAGYDIIFGCTAVSAGLI